MLCENVINYEEIHLVDVSVFFDNVIIEEKIDVFIKASDISIEED